MQSPSLSPPPLSPAQSEPGQLEPVQLDRIVSHNRRADKAASWIRQGAKTQIKSHEAAALTLGLLSFLFGLLTGVPAIVLGLRAKRTHDRHGSPCTGVALAAIMTGFAGSLLGAAVTLLVVAGVVGSRLQSQSGHASAAAPSAASLRGYGPPEAHDGKAYGGAIAGTIGAPPETDDDSVDEAAAPVAPRMFGSVRLLTANARDPHSLKSQMEKAQKENPSHEIWLITTGRHCDPCEQIDASLTDPAMQAAFANVTLLKVDVLDFEDDLESMHLSDATLPWFFRTDRSLHVTGALSAGEWEENVPSNMAPVVRAFRAGTLRARREPVRSSAPGIDL